MEFPELRYLKITGDISIEPVTGRIPKDPLPFLYLIMGPTGAGKSSFIEALAGKSQQLSISKDQLAGYTQTVNAYKVVNVTRNGHPAFLVDTPGFSDLKISEVEIIDMVRNWLKNNNLEYVHRILFLTPITETRLPGSRRRTIAMLKQHLVPTNSHSVVKFVTTMWDTLHNEQTQKRAESNFEQLRDEVCKDFFGDFNVSITQFMNTKNSALEVVDATIYYMVDSFAKPESSASPNLYQDLHKRMEAALQEKQMLESELAQPDAQINADLRAILERNQRENHETLTKFIEQLVNFGPLPPGFRHAAQRLRKSIATNTMPPNGKYKLLYWQWKHEAEIPADRDLDTSMGVLVIKGLAQSLFKVPQLYGAGAEPSERGE